MFGFGSKKNKSKKSKALRAREKEKAAAAELSGEALRAQALANARKARDHLGDETVQKIAAIMAKREQSTFVQAQRTIQNADVDRVNKGLLSMIDEK